MIRGAAASSLTLSCSYRVCFLVRGFRLILGRCTGCECVLLLLLMTLLLRLRLLLPMLLLFRLLLLTVLLRRDLQINDHCVMKYP